MRRKRSARRDSGMRVGDVDDVLVDASWSSP